MTRKLLVWGIAVAVIGGGVWLGVRHRRSASPPAKPAPVAAAPSGVGCLGKIEPEGSVVLVTAPYYDGRPSLVAELKVKEGDRVRKDQVLAVLDSRSRLEASLREADARIAVAREKVQQVRAGPKEADVEALKAQRAGLQASLANAQAEAARYASLLPGGATSRASAEGKALAVETLKRAIEESDSKIRALSEVKPDDVRAAELEADDAVVARQQVEAALEQSVVKAPFAGRVLALHARQGEAVGSNGLLELASTNRMYIIAEVYEPDIARVRVGQQATATGPLLNQPLRGAVERIDRQVGPATVLTGDPLAFSDKRVVRVFIRLAEGQNADLLIHSTVNVSIEP